MSLCWGIADYTTEAALSAYGRGDYGAMDAMDGLTSLLVLAAMILTVILSFKAKNALEKYSGKSLSGAATFFFGFFYINISSYY